MQQIVFDNLRIQILSDDIVRVERAKNGAFCDDNTFFVPDREQYSDNKPEYSFSDGVLRLHGYELYMPTSSTSLSGLTVKKDDKKVYFYKKLRNSGELPPLDKTPEVFALADTPRIIIPEGGYSKNRDGQYKVTENVSDVYLLFCNKDARKLRKLYVELTGRPEMVRLATLGGWNSKYYAYSEETAKQLILDYEAHDVPLDNMVIDTDWRSCENGWGYDVNKQLFPDMKRFIDFAHSHGVDIMFNDHPEPVDGACVFRGKEIAYREKNLQALMKIGLDTWWYDRNWNTHLVSPSKNVMWETFGLYLFHDITKHFYQNKANNKDIYRRPDVMGNVVNVENGVYRGIADSASHRYGFQWTGDIDCTLESMGQEVKNLLFAGNNSDVYVNADCGGHFGDPDKHDFVRWMQFGTLSPIFRPHCCNVVARTREPWTYDEETVDIVREYNNLRYRLLPVIYKNARHAYETGEPIFKALGWEYPQDKRALGCTDEYMLGNDILIKPMSRQLPFGIVEKERFTKPVRATYYDGIELRGEPLAHAEYDDLSICLDGESPEDGVPVYNFSARFETEVLFDTDVELVFRGDDGATIWIDGEKVLEDKTCHRPKHFPLQIIEGGKTHEIIIEYFQAAGGAVAELLYNKVTKSSYGKTSVYLPEGKWLNPFNGKIYVGGKTVYADYALRETPLFVRVGAIIPLAHNAKNTKEQKWNSLVLDYYPDKTARDCGYLYEDDGETTAYKRGEFSKTPYEAFYDEGDNAYVVGLHSSEGRFDGEKCYKKRNVFLKVHLINGLNNVDKVLLNGSEVDFRIRSRAQDAFPLNASEFAADGRVVTVEFVADADQEYEIKLY